MRLAQNPIAVVLGPRQIGKTTPISQVAKSLSGPVHVFGLKDPQDLARLAEPGLALRILAGTVVLEEAQRLLNNFPLRVLAVRRPLPARFLFSGSASPERIKDASQTLAGRFAHYEVEEFKLDEVPKQAGAA